MLVHERLYVVVYKDVFGKQLIIKFFLSSVSGTAR